MSDLCPVCDKPLDSMVWSGSEATSKCPSGHFSIEDHFGVTETKVGSETWESHYALLEPESERILNEIADAAIRERAALGMGPIE